MPKNNGSQTWPHPVIVKPDIMNMPCTICMTPILGKGLDVSPSDYVCLICLDAMVNALMEFMTGKELDSINYDLLNPDKDVDLSDINPTVGTLNPETGQIEKDPVFKQVVEDLNAPSVFEVPVAVAPSPQESSPEEEAHLPPAARAARKQVASRQSR